MTVLLCLLLAMPVRAASGEVAGKGATAVLFHYGPEQYYWGNASVAANADAIEVSKAAAEAIDRGFVYDNATGAVEVGGLRPGPNDTWKWSLLSWDARIGRWAPWTGDPHGLRPQSGGAIAWSPSDIACPAPDPWTRYPWPMDRSSATRRGETLSPAPPGNLTFWTAAVGGFVSASPCVANGKVFILAGNDPNGGQGTALVCLEELTGRTLWRRELAGRGQYYTGEESSPAFAEGRIFFGTSDGVFRALNASDGREEWNFSVDSPYGGYLCSPVIAGRSVVFTTDLNAIYCLGMDGSLEWKNVPTGGVALQNSGPAVLGGRVVYGEDDGNLTCRDVHDGSLIWSIYLGKPRIYTPALSQEGYAFVAASDAGPSGLTLFSIFLRDGVQQWNATYPWCDAPPAQAAGGLFIGTGEGLAGYHPDRGTRVWNLPVGSMDAGPVVAQGFVYYATGALPGVVGCVRVGGQPEWAATLDGRFHHSPAIADGRLFVVNSAGMVWCLGRSPEPRLGARLSVAEKAVENDVVKVKASFNNTGEAAALFTARLMADGTPTGVNKGPYSLRPGESLNISFEWTAKKGKHTFGLWSNGTGARVEGANMTVEARSSACAIVYYVPFAAGAALLVPLIARSGRGKRGDGE